MRRSPDFAPVWCSSSSGVPSNMPPTRPALARNSSITFALNSAGEVDMGAPRVVDGPRLPGRKPVYARPLALSNTVRAWSSTRAPTASRFGGLPGPLAASLRTRCEGARRDRPLLRARAGRRRHAEVLDLAEPRSRQGRDRAAERPALVPILVLDDGQRRGRLRRGRALGAREPTPRRRRPPESPARGRDGSVRAAADRGAAR